MLVQPASLQIIVEDRAAKPRADELAIRLGLDHSKYQNEPAILLFVSSVGLSIATKNDTSSRISVDFNTGKNAHRRKFGGGVNQAIARACGLNKIQNAQIIDATGGLARDAFVLASLGATLKILEQSTILCVLIEDALLAGNHNPDIAEITQRMCVENCNSLDALKQPENLKAADVVYMDPMYPTRQKNAAVKKDMQMLHLLIGPDSDANNLLKSALLAARKRVVVKRPIKARPISLQRLVGNVSSKNTRYDIYAPNEDAN